MAPDLFMIFLGEEGARGGLWTRSRGEEQGLGKTTERMKVLDMK